MSTINENLKILLKELGLSQRQFAQALYLDPGYFSKIIQGKMPLNSRLQLLIENTFKVNGDWLRTGEGDIFLVPADSSSTGSRSYARTSCAALRARGSHT